MRLCLECSGKGCRACDGHGETVLNAPPTDYIATLVAAAIEKHRAGTLTLSERLAVAALLGAL